ncbi:TetR family transcriptional regulator [Nocardia sp. NPDC059091]|uniref:TetR family transcriptional regulator n=1 Tax=unclassified Nocardia TaxID=2637762 RepID=UPI0036B9B93A
MPRIAEDRLPAQPSSPEQESRRQRILRAAAHHGAEKGLERVQMHDVAKDAGVAIATLYRYFPSKTHLFNALLSDRVKHLAETTPLTRPGVDRVQAVSDLLVEGGRELLSRPLLAHAMLQSNLAAVAQAGGVVTNRFSDLITQLLGVEHASDAQARLVRITEAAWYGVLNAALNHHITAEQAEEDTRVACRKLLSGIEELA